MTKYNISKFSGNVFVFEKIEFLWENYYFWEFYFCFGIFWNYF